MFTNPNETKENGRLYVFEGPDGCGKSTTIKEVYQMLKESGYKVKMRRDQTDHNQSCNKIRSIIHDEFNTFDPISILLLQLASRVELNKLLYDDISNGYIVLLDRYFPSTFVYQTSFKFSHFSYEYLIKMMRLSGMDIIDMHALCNKIIVFDNDRPFKKSKDDEIEKNTNYNIIMQKYRNVVEFFSTNHRQYKKYEILDTRGKSKQAIAHSIYNIIKSDIKNS